MTYLYISHAIHSSDIHRLKWLSIVSHLLLMSHHVQRYRDHLIQEWKAWRMHVTKGLVCLVSWDREKGRGVNRNIFGQVINWVHSSIYVYVPYSLFTLVIPVNLCVYGLKQSYMSGFFCTFVHIMLSGTCFFEGNSQQTVQDTHGATVIMQGKGNNSKDKTITKRSMHDWLK